MILEVFQAQMEHFRDMDRRAQEAARRSEIMGACFGFILGLAGLAVAWFTVSRGHAAAGSVVGVIDVVALVGIFVHGRRQQQSPVRRIQTQRKKFLFGSIPPLMKPK